MNYDVPDYDPDCLVEVFRQLTKACHERSVAKGFWPGGPVAANHGEKIALMHSELSEALEATRELEMPPSKKIPGFTLLEEEMADEIIRVCDYAGAYGLRLGEAVLAKHAYNGTRPPKHRKGF